MLVATGLILLLIVIAWAIRHELRSALYGVALSNGVEVLVSQAMYGSIVRRYRAADGADDLVRWDQAILDTLRPERPNEWKFLVRSLGYRVSGELGVSRRWRRSQIAKR
jgi:hypothetical protein